MTLKVLLTLTGIVFISGCAGVNPPAQLDPVPQIHPGLLQGYLAKDKLPNSLALLPPAPAKGSAADKLDQKISQNSLSLRGTPRWELAKQDANIHFPRAADTFSCVKSMAPQRNCEVESKALSQYPPSAPWPANK